MLRIQCHRTASRRLLRLLAVISFASIVSAQSGVDCSVCGSGLVVTSPDNTLQDPFGDSEVTCGDIEGIGQSGGYSSLECAAIQFAVFANCDCQADSGSTDQPTASPVASTNTDAPTVAPTDRPTDAPTIETEAPTAASIQTEAPTDSTTDTTSPTDPPTDAPTKEPTTNEPTTLSPTAAPSPLTATNAPTAASTTPLDKLPTVTGMVMVNLNKVAGAMPVTTIAAYEQQMTQFFTDTLAESSPPVRNVTAKLLRQTVVSSRRHAVRRHLQSTTSLAPLETILQVSGRRDTLDGKNGTMDGLLVQTVQENADELVDQYLRNATPAINQIYFKPVESVTAAPVPAEPAPTPAPTASPVQDSGLGIGAIIGIIVAGLFIVAVCMGVIWYNQVGKVKMMEDLAGDPEIKRRISERSLNASAAENEAATEKPLTASKTSPAAAAAAVTQRNEPPAAPVLDQDDDGSEEDEDDDVESQTDEPPSDDEPEPAAPIAPVTAGKITKTITAPAGKLGIVIDTTLEGPVIHKVNMLSPLEGMLKAGDIIVAINDVDTKAMGSSAITALMIKTANQKRTLTVLTDG